ncbi:restriction endonuclease [Prevotella pectinovora]|uniref:restriction endonuclease n=1 Tax=Prevotella pectinovora TaxID=1602169 RepID=UPI003A912F21
MRILIEEYQYEYEDVYDVLKGLGVLQDVEGKVSLSYVGYYFNDDPDVNDCVFILPKVLLEGEFGKEKVFGHIEPKDLINAEDCKELTTEEHTFIYNLSVWIYRAITVFRDHEFDRVEDGKRQSSIVFYKQAPMMGHTRKRRANTFLDVLLTLQEWNKRNESFVMFIVKDLHSGYNKINWTRTISRSQAVIQESIGSTRRQDVSYLNPINKKRQINFDEELLVIYYSILQHMHDKYGFPVSINVNFPLIRGDKFARYISGYGKRRLKQIKYKYFSDKALELWELCHAFFDRPDNIMLNVDQREYMLVKSFHIVFEAIIDELIAGDQKLPKELKDQPDGKRVDHLYQYKELTNNDTDDNIYYIGDSKYYKRGNSLGKESVYKQFTYARNVIQWNIDLFNDGKAEDRSGHVKLRDDVTEGYNIIPNFFISANQNVLRPENDIKLIDSDKEDGKRRQQYYLSRQFENRLFDRDTFLLAHYDVNFLFVVALYGRNNSASKVQWRNKVRRMFRIEIQQMLKENFEFYAMTAKSDVNPDAYLRENFQQVLGKVYHPFDNREGSDQQYFSLALRKPEKEADAAIREKVASENEAVMFELKHAFYIAKCPLGVDPRTLPEDVMPRVEARPHDVIPKQFLTMHYLENYPKATFLIGIVNGMEHLHWIFSRKGGKRDDAYNVRLGKEAHGGVVKSRDYVKHAKFVILYNAGENKVYKAFRVKNTGELTREQMISQGYLRPRHDKYFCYFFDEEITLGEFDIHGIIEADKKKHEVDAKQKEEYAEGQPIFMSGEELIKFRK